MYFLTKLCEFSHKRILPSIVRRRYTVLAIESSCDDSCVSIVNSKKQVLSEKRLSFAETQRLFKGICPHVSAQLHRSNIDRLVDECVEEAGIRISDLDAIASTVKPGIVLCLKVGADKALALCRDYRVGFLPVHHMRAHALVSRLVFDDIQFPFLCLLISGGHAILCIVEGVEDFAILNEATSASPGEVIDKVARAAGLIPKTHYGAVVEEYAKRSTNSNPTPYVTKMPRSKDVDFDFMTIKHRFIDVLNRQTVNLEDFCLNLQLIIAGHMCQKLDFVFQYLDSIGAFKSENSRNLVVSGGVAANLYFRTAIEKIASHHGFKTRFPPTNLVTDNATMIAWTAIEMLNARFREFIEHDKIPSSILVLPKSPIGRDIRGEFAQFTPTIKLKVSSLHSREQLGFRGVR